MCKKTRFPQAVGRIFRKEKRVIRCLSLLAICLLTHCGAPQPPRGVLRLNAATGLNGLDPAYARNEATVRLTQQIFTGLVRLNAALEVEPALAHRWEVRDSGRVYRFFLRKDVYFHPHRCLGPDSSRRVRASDVVYSLSRIVDPAVLSPGAWIFSGRVKGAEQRLKGKSQSVDGFVALNDSVVEIRLKAAFPPFLKLLAMPYGYVVPREVIECLGPEGFRRAPIGTGPFLFRSWRPGRSLVLHRNPRYYEPGKPLLKALQVRFIGSKLSAYAAFLNHELDVLDNLDPAVVEEFFSVAGERPPNAPENILVETAPQLTLEYLGMMTDSSLRAGHPLRNPHLRKAINYAINRRALVRYLLRNQATPATAGVIPYGLPAYDSVAVRGYRYNLAKAKQHLAAAGYPGGEGLPPLVLNSNPNYRHISAFLQKALAEIGIRLEVIDYEGSALRDQIYEGSIDFWRASWIADYPEGENFLALFYGPNAAPEGPNTTRFRSATFDRLYRRALRTPHDSARFALYHQMEAEIRRQAPVVPLFYYRSLSLRHPRVKGWQVSASPLVLDLRQVSLSPSPTED